MRLNFSTVTLFLRLFSVTQNWLKRRLEARALTHIKYVNMNIPKEDLFWRSTFKKSDTNLKTFWGVQFLRLCKHTYVCACMLPFIHVVFEAHGSRKSALIV